MTVCSLRIHWLAVLTALAIAVVLSACSEPRATPASAPMYTPTPEPMPTQVSTPAYSAELDLQTDSTWQQAFDAFSTPEQACIRSELGEDLLRSVMEIRVLEGDDTEQWHVSIFECLDPETAAALLFFTITADLTTEEGFDEEQARCLREFLANSDIAEFIAATLPDAAPESAPMLEEYAGEYLTCLDLGHLLPSNDWEPAAGPPPPNDSLLWQYDTGNPGEMVLVSPTMGDGVLYAGSYDDFVYALDANTGELLWSLKAQDHLNPPPLLAGGVLFVNGQALNASTGQLLRDDNSPHNSSDQATVSGQGTVYIPIEIGDNAVTVRATDAGTGDTLWETNVPRSSRIPLLFPLTVSGGKVYVSDEFQVHALDSSTGTLVWTFDAGDILQVPPTSTNGVVYLQSYTAAHALDESTGNQLWSYQVDFGGLNDRPPSITNGVWHLVSTDDLRALDAATGHPLWSFEDDIALLVSQVADGIVFLTGVNAFHALDAATGDEIWSLDPSWNLTDATVVDSVLYANSLSGYLHTIDARTGEPIWSVDIGYHLGGAHDPYLVSEGVLYVGYQLAGSGVYAFAAPGGR